MSRVPCEVWAAQWRQERKDREAFVIACVLYAVLGWPIEGLTSQPNCDIMSRNLTGEIL